MENIKELRKKCQPPREKDLERFGWFMAYITRFFSIYFTKIFLKLNVTTNQITLLCIVLGISSAVLFSTGKYYFMLLGSIILLFELLFGNVDGELFRYKGGNNPVGKWIDSIGHYIVEPFTYMGLSIGLYKMFNNIIHIIVGFLLVQSWFLESYV